MSNSMLGSFFVDSVIARASIFLGLVSGIALCMVYVLIMSYASEWLAKICIFLTQIGLIGLAVLCWLQRSKTLETRAQ